MSRNINYKAYRSADKWQELGLIGDTLQFTDDEIVTQQAIGYTKHLVPYNCPMDIAVVYSMLNRGQGATPTAKELLNDHTRLAYLFESRQVADGWYYEVPADEELYTCTPATDFPQLSYYTQGYHNLSNAPALDPAKLAGFIAKVLENNDNSMMNTLLSAYNWESTNARTVFRRAAEYTYKSFFSFKRDGTVNNQPFQDMMKAQHDEGTRVRASTVIALIQEYVPWTIDGGDRCGRPADNEKFCTVHRPKNFWTREWVFGSGEHKGKTLYNNEPISYFEKDKPQTGKDLHITLSKFFDHKRQLIQQVNDKEVLKHMNKSLTRMCKRGTVRQVSHGRGRMFEWTAWSWLENIRSRILASNAKQRKIGDEVNGWKYTTGRTTESFGMEIHDHDWKPVEEVHVWRVKINLPSIDYYNRQDTTTVKLSLIFFDRDSAMAHKNKLEAINTILYPSDEDESNSVPTLRYVDDDYNVTSPLGTYAVIKEKINMSVDGIATIEDYDDPATMFKRIQMSNKDGGDAIVATLRQAPSRYTTMKKVTQ